MSHTFPHWRLRGSHREVGRQHGEARRLGAVELAQMIRRRAVSCREVVTAALARLDAVNPRINAVVRPLHETALAEAAAADQALVRGAAVPPVQPGGGSVKGRRGGGGLSRADSFSRQGGQMAWVN